jgi:hypothetical protein
VTQHPYIGLAGTIDDMHRPNHGRHGVVESCDGSGVMLLLDNGHHEWMGLPCFVPDDPTEARRRLTDPAREWTGPDRWQIATSNGPTVGNPPDKDAPADYEPIGAWQPFASADSWTDWRRPLRRVQA